MLFVHINLHDVSVDTGELYFNRAHFQNSTHCTYFPNDFSYKALPEMWPSRDPITKLAQNRLIFESIKYRKMCQPVHTMFDNHWKKQNFCGKQNKPRWHWTDLLRHSLKPHSRIGTQILYTVTPCQFQVHARPKRILAGALNWALAPVIRIQCNRIWYDELPYL